MNQRFPRSVYDVGSEPDPRFSLANERTFLAWISFALASISLGVGLESFALGLNRGFRTTASLLLILLGSFAPVRAWMGWKRVERAMREGQPLPSLKQGLTITIVICTAGLLVVLGVVFL